MNYERRKGWIVGRRNFYTRNFREKLKNGIKKMAVVKSRIIKSRDKQLKCVAQKQTLRTNAV